MQTASHDTTHVSGRNPMEEREGEERDGVRLPSPRITNPSMGRTPDGRGAESLRLAAQGAALPMAGLVHDARNMLSALHLYCDLLEEPGVLSTGHRHYAGDLQLVARAAGRLVEQISWIATRPPQNIPTPHFALTGVAEALSLQTAVSLEGQSTETATLEPEYLPLESTAGSVPMTPAAGSDIRAQWIADVGHVVRAAHPLLSALAGPAVDLEVECLECEGRVRLTSEDLTRVLVNLVSNAKDAMPRGGTVRITAQKGGGVSFLPGELTAARPETVLVAVQDTGSGVPAEVRDRIFEAGFSTRMGFHAWPANTHRGLGLSIARSLVELAGGSMRLVSRAGWGARFEMEFPTEQRVPTGAAHITDPTQAGGIAC